MRSTRFLICAAMSFALSLIALAGISLPDVNGFQVVNYSVGSLPESVAVGDFNADGKPDLAVANGEGCPASPTKEGLKAPNLSGNSVSITLGNGTVNYFVAANLSSTGRKGKITIAGQTLSIKQKSH